jgi:nitrilase
MGAKVVVLPEAFVGGYPKGADFGARVGSRSAEGRLDFAAYAAGAIQIPSAETELLSEAARGHRVQVVIGVIERHGGTLYCTALGFDHEGSLRGRHRKVMPTAAERIIWGFGDGSTLDVWDSPQGRVGAVICWENYMPLLRTAMYAQGIQIYCAPTVDDRETWLPTMRHIAIEGRCFVLSACQFTDGGGDPKQQIRGGSCIVGPLGEVLAGPIFGERTILTAELDLSRLIEAKFDLDTTGHYARPDIFHLSVDKSQRNPVSW